MSNRKRIKLADYIERKMEAANIIELPDGTEIAIPPAELWGDAVFTALAEGRTADAVATILGTQHEAFIAAGGHWRILNGIIGEMQGLDVGESAASSES